MKILLLTRNHVVREFIELVADRVGAELEVLADVSGVEQEKYDFLLVDDRGMLLEESMPLLERLDIRQSLVFYSEKQPLHEHFDQQIKKPFLPSDIQKILEAEIEKQAQYSEEQVLDIQDIEEIRSLLEGEGLEIVSEETLPEVIDGKDAEDQGNPEESREEELLAAIRNMKPKEIRKLLKGAELTLTIRFPKEHT